jgi:serine/threonine protein kinase
MSHSGPAAYAGRMLHRPGGTRPLYHGRFEGLTRVGHGAMGVVYKAWDRGSRRHVALKVLRQEALKDRFAREARVLATMAHRHIVGYVDHGVAKSGELWLAMEWLEGEDLASRLERGPLDMRDTMALARGVAQALGWAHERGFVHRDIKPSNLFLPDGDVDRVKVLDFGLARLVQEAEGFTQTGMLMGTLEYMPPEQAVDAKRVDARADIFSLGAVLYHCLVGHPPSTGATMSEILSSILRDKPPPVRDVRTDVPIRLDELIGRMLSKDAMVRPANGAAVLAALGRVPVEPGWESLSTFPVVMDWLDRSLPNAVAIVAPRPVPPTVLSAGSSDVDDAKTARLRVDAPRERRPEADTEPVVLPMSVRLPRLRNLLDIILLLAVVGAAVVLAWSRFNPPLP